MTVTELGPDPDITDLFSKKLLHQSFTKSIDSILRVSLVGLLLLSPAAVILVKAGPLCLVLGCLPETPPCLSPFSPY